MGQHDTSRDDRAIFTVLPERIGNTKVNNLSSGERALIYRRRMGIKQSDMAKAFGMSRRAYGQAEAADKIDLPGFMIVVEPLAPNEKCFLWRYRSGFSQKELAEFMGISRYWLNLMELGRAPTDRLEAFWNER